MKRARRFPSKSARWVSLAVCLTLLLSGLTFAPLQEPEKGTAEWIAQWPGKKGHTAAAAARAA
jgi:hypothetical protein